MTGANLHTPTNWYPIERLQAGINLHWIDHESRSPKPSERIVQFRIHWFFKDLINARRSDWRQ